MPDVSNEIKYRDTVLRDYIIGRNWDKNSEFNLLRSLLLHTPEELRPFPYLYEYEWEVVPGRSNEGCGDLVFTDGEGNFAVVEAKFIDLQQTGHSARVRRTKHRKTVKEQANRYAYHLQQNLGPKASSTVAFYFTNEDPAPLRANTFFPTTDTTFDLDFDFDYDDDPFDIDND